MKLGKYEIKLEKRKEPVSNTQFLAWSFLFWSIPLTILGLYNSFYPSIVIGIFMLGFSLWILYELNKDNRNQIVEARR